MTTKQAAALLDAIRRRLANGDTCLRYEAECMRITTAELKRWLYPNQNERSNPA